MIGCGFVQIVRAVIESTMLEQFMSSNVICSGYDKVKAPIGLLLKVSEFRYECTVIGVCI